MGSEDKHNLVLPEGTSLYLHQVAGHQYNGKTKLDTLLMLIIIQGVLKHINGSIIKPVQENDLRSSKELLFYESVFNEEHVDPLLSELQEFLPRFQGTCLAKVGDKEMKFLCLEDVCTNFANPSILDVKIGKITYDPEANQAKIDYERSKYLYSELLGFRILGMKVYCNSKKLYMIKDKKFGKQVTPNEMKNVLQLLLTSNVLINCVILSIFLHKLQNLAEWFKKQRKLTFISSSLLFVYEGNLTLWFKFIENNLHEFCDFQKYTDDSDILQDLCLKNISDDNLENESFCKICLLKKNLCNKVNMECKLVRVVMIDCAHVFPSSEEDSNYLHGLESLIQYLQQLLHDQNKCMFTNR